MLWLLLKQENKEKILRRMNLFCILVRPNTGMLIVAGGQTDVRLGFFIIRTNIEPRLSPNEKLFIVSNQRLIFGQ